MNVSVGKDFEAYVKHKVASGDYASVSEVVRDALRLLKEKELVLAARLQAMSGEIQVGIDQAASGQFLDGEDAMQKLRDRIMRKNV